LNAEPFHKKRKRKGRVSPAFFVVQNDQHWRAALICGVQAGGAGRAAGAGMGRICGGGAAGRIWGGGAAGRI